MARHVVCEVDKDAAWAKVSGRAVVVLDMNCWINMAEAKSAVASRVKHVLRKLVSEGEIISPLTWGLIVELHKQAPDSRLRVGALMEELSLNVTFVKREEAFFWEVEKAARLLTNSGPFTLLTHGLYAPVCGYLHSQFTLSFADDVSDERVEFAVRRNCRLINAISLTQIISYRTQDGRDLGFEGVNRIPTPKYSEEAAYLRERYKGSKEKIMRKECELNSDYYISPALLKLPPLVRLKFRRYIDETPKDKYGGILGELLTHLPSIRNHAELMTATSL